MKLAGPDHYRVSIASAPSSPQFEIEDSHGSGKFSGRATSKLPKLYVVSAGRRPIYVGITRQSMRQRLRYGWSANGKGGYYGYQWRHHFSEVSLDVWYLDAPASGNLMLDIETIEAEVVFLIRQHGQWPAFQTEIHFHPSKPAHRRAAAKIWSHYAPAAAGR